MPLNQTKPGLVTDLFFLSPFIYLVFVCWSYKGMNDGKRQVYFKLYFYFWRLQLFCGAECFPQPVEIAVLHGWGIRGISGIVLPNCESLESSIGGLSTCHVCLWLVVVSIWWCDEVEISHAIWPEGQKTCELQLAPERKRSHPFQSRW